jgi:Sec-independent protein secretion pathway component TatC
MNHGPASDSLNRTAFQATVHCLTGCGIGEVLGLVLSTALGWHDLPSILLAIVLAFIFGYGLTIRPLLAGGLPFRSAARTALAADTVSIVVMEVMDNAIVVALPGAMAAGLTDGLFWGSLMLSLAVAFVVAFPVNRWLIARGLGHAVIHAQHAAVGHRPHD